MDFWTWSGRANVKPAHPKPDLPAAYSEMERQGRYSRFDAERFRLHTYLAPGHTQITRPVLWVWGFDPSGPARSPGDLFLLLNGTWTDSDEAPDPNARLIEALWERGLDVLILMPRDTTRNVSFNAEGLRHCLRLLRDGRDIEILKGARIDENVVIGISMGGVIARYALCAMERNGDDHRTRFYFSYDTPHRGANIPLSVQYFLDYFHKTELGVRVGAVADKLDLVNSPAACELAFYHYDAPPAGKSSGTRWESQTKPQPHPARTQLLFALEAMGNYPLSRDRRFAISNGGAAKSQGAVAGQQLLEVKIGPLGNPGAIFRALPHHGAADGVDVVTCWSGLNKWTAHVALAHPLEIAAGSTGPFIKDVRANLAHTFGLIAHIRNDYHENVCFVPVASALDIGDDVWNLGPAPGRPVTLANFGDYFVNADRNEAHVRVTTEIQSFILNKLEAWR